MSTSSKKKRMSMLDTLAAAGTPSPATTGSMMPSNRALRSARDAVDSHHVWELNPDHIIDDRMNDRLDPSDVADLRDAIDTNGQAVPILVRRHPSQADRYLLVYGRRRLEAIRLSTKVTKVRALVASLDDDAALKAQISENTARRDLSYIEKALFARELIDTGFGNQTQVADVLTVTKSAISMALNIVDMVGSDLIHAIGPAPGIGRPKWDALGKAIGEARADRANLAQLAENVHTRATVDHVRNQAGTDPADISVDAFNAVMRTLTPPSKPMPGDAQARRPLKIAGNAAGSIHRTAKGITITLESGAFADWLSNSAQDVIDELHTRWTEQAEIKS